MGGQPTEGEVAVRSAGARDLDALVSLSLACRRVAVTWSGADWAPAALVAERTIWWDRLEDPGTWVAVATAGPSRVGAIALTGAAGSSGPRSPQVAYFAGPIVDPEWWHAGVGNALVEAAHAQALERGFARGELFVEMGNARGRAFLEGHGWERQEAGPRRSPVALVLYARELAAQRQGAAVAAA